MIRCKDYRGDVCSFDCASTLTGDFSNRYVAKVTDITGMVYGAPTFNVDPSERALQRSQT